MSAPVTKAEYEALLKRVGARESHQNHVTRGRPNLVPLAREAAMMAMRVEAAALRRDINEAQILIGRVQRLYLNDNTRNGHHRLRVRLVAVLRRAARERGGPLPSIDVADALWMNAAS